jgi:hypothetical protein
MQRRDSSNSSSSSAHTALVLTTRAHACNNHPSLQVFCGNFEYDAPEKEILGLFEKYGRVTRIDMKTGEPRSPLKWSPGAG